ncbi:MaoC family dehydratase [Streptosporangium sp. NBC_01755]|uniref:MaoC family dehydratase n=1 Tax=unclassified Streptosporangium TaxID=2632669 RepID=UPI002DD9ABA5|nr:MULTISPECIES: MaoC family dehydratase [unclassified Streptosporangium]WSA29000.1 MaoC family dehydratase [Streptosporangium sp. NBC_01810]WSC99553.1 MaoC family dehydratase [Streptosporangium sp. NBC_01755]
MTVTVEGPYFDELTVGQVFDGAPGVTLTAGHAAAHQAIVGDRLRLPLDADLCRDVTKGEPPAHPALVWDVAIGQSTLVTHHVKANLFYRGLVFRRMPLLGDTLRTSTQVVALRQNRAKPGRRPTGLAVLRITTVDQAGRPVLDFWRCAMLPLRDPEALTGHQADLDSVGVAVTDEDLAETVTGMLAGWRLDRFRERVAGRHFAGVAEGERLRVGGGDVVSGAPELARLTLNVAQVHHDVRAAAERRLVYGGHTVGLALSQASRALPNLVTVVAWDGCDHVGPVHEGDTLSSEVVVERRQALPGGGGLVRLRSLVQVVGGDGPRDVLDWRYVAVMA